MLRPPGSNDYFARVCACGRALLAPACAWSISPPAADYYNDLYSFDPATVKWVKLNPSGSVPSPRHMMGFAATPDGMLYVFGGYTMDNVFNSQIYGGNKEEDGASGEWEADRCN